MIKNIIFDLAGVILNLDIERDTKALNQVGLPDFMGCLASPAIAEPMVAYLNGLKSEEDFCRELRPSCLPGITDEEMLWSMDAVLADIPASRLQMLARLKQEYNIYLLSNIYDKAWKHAVKEVEQNGFSLDQCFDGLFLSHEMLMPFPNASGIPMKLFASIARMKRNMNQGMEILVFSPFFLRKMKIETTDRGIIQRARVSFTVVATLRASSP